MNGEYEMCACGHFRKDHARGSGVTISNCGCGSPEFRKRNYLNRKTKFNNEFTIQILQINATIIAGAEDSTMDVPVK